MKRLHVHDRVMMSYDACTSRAFRVLRVASLQRLKMEAIIRAPADCEVRSGIKFLNAEHSVDRNSSSVMPGLRTHTDRRPTHLLQEFCWEVFNHHPPYFPDLSPNDFHLFLHLKNSCTVSVNIFRMTGGDECHSGSSSGES